MSAGRNRLIIGLLFAVIIFLFPLFPFLLEDIQDNKAFPQTIGNTTLIRESRGMELLDLTDTPGLSRRDIVNVQKGDYVDMWGNTASIIMIQYPSYRTASDQLESLKGVSGASQAYMEHLTAPAVFYVSEGSSARFFYVKKSTLYIVELRGVERHTLDSAIVEV